MSTAWTVAVEMIRASKHVELNGMLDKYQAKLFGGVSTCWIPGARKLIVRKAVEAGILPKEETP